MTIPGSSTVKRQQIPSSLATAIKPPGAEVHGPCADKQSPDHHARTVVASLLCTCSIPVDAQY